MALTVSEVAKLSGVSVRTLHHYDAIGLLKPGYTGDNGYRYYERPELLRLQQVLFYRDVGMPLGEIKQTLDDPDFDPAAALKQHRERLRSEIENYRQLISTIDATLLELSGEKEMENPFKGFNPEKQKGYEQELVDRYGDGVKAQIAESYAKVGKLSPDQIAAVQEEGHQVSLGLAAQIKAGDAPGSDAVQALIARHYNWVSNFWTPDAEAYAGLGQLYLDHPDFRAFYDKYDDRLVDFLAAAMAIWAEAHLD